MQIEHRRACADPEAHDRSGPAVKLFAALLKTRCKALKFRLDQAERLLRRPSAQIRQSVPASIGSSATQASSAS